MWTIFSTRKGKRGANRKADEIYLLSANVKSGGFFSRSEKIWKVGITGQSPGERIAEIEADGGPRFRCEYSAMRSDARELEQRLHRAFAAKNIDFERERFAGVTPGFGGHTECFRFSSWEVAQVKKAMGAGGGWAWATVGLEKSADGAANWLLPYTALIMLFLMALKSRA